ncbi:MAG: hypothetical protein R3314_13375, partial [Longimicrobiales bacterium]|nr:hypothetical protein [Longimicrobiales bacterium]
DPATRVVLRSDGARLTVEGPAEATLRRVAGLGVRVDGRRDGSTIRAVGFRVREAAGMPAADGTLEVRGDTAVLFTPGGRLRYVPVPAALKARDGARVWIAGQAGREPQAWGVIAP